MSNGDLPANEMSKREAFAAMALQGILASSTDEFPSDAEASRWAVEYADALLAALDDKKELTP